LTFDRDNLTNKQQDFAVFLPALSGFYANFVGKQRFGAHVDAARIPRDFETGVEGLNWLNPEAAYFQYRWALYSAGHAELDINKDAPGEDMIRNRDRNNSFVVGDSGGFQIGKGVWQGDWKNPNCPKAQKKRELVLKWMDTYMDRGMILDIPAWVKKIPAGRAASGISTYAEAVQGTYINNEYFMQNRSGACQFLNVLQGDNHAEADDWYERMKKYCDPKQYAQPFEGWAMGGQNMCDVHLTLRRLVALRFDGLLEKGQQDWMHFLGTSKLEWALLLTDIQRAVRKYHNPNFTISFDCASPFLASANGFIYFETAVEDRTKWTYRTLQALDNKSYAMDTRRYRDAVLADKILPKLLDSPVIQRCRVNDICIYKDGVRKTAAELGGVAFDLKNPEHYHVLPDLNKIDRIGKTSWDSFSYCIQMGHNVWSHIHSVQEANRLYDTGVMPAMLDSGYTSRKKSFPNLDRRYFRDIVDAIFACSDRDKAMQLVDYYQKYMDTIPGSRGNTLDRLYNNNSSFEDLFGSDSDFEFARDDSGMDESALALLENDAS
jgi:hypothetical protein